MALTAMVVGAATVPACAVVLARTALGTARAAVRGVPVDVADALLAVLAAAGVLGLAWLALGVALEALSRAPGAVGTAAARVSAGVSPLVVRRAAAVLVGIGIGAGATAGPAPAASVRSATAVMAEAVAGSTPLPDPGWAAGTDPGWTPTAPRVRPQPDVEVVSGRAAARQEGEVVVHRGDSLWSIAARHLGGGASDAEVAREWPRWYDTNRDVVGPDPDLLLPGQVLHAPESVPS